MPFNNHLLFSSEFCYLSKKERKKEKKKEKNSKDIDVLTFGGFEQESTIKDLFMISYWGMERVVDQKWASPTFLGGHVSEK